MEPNVLIKHLSAAKANQVEQFPLRQFKELAFGREPSCEVRYDAVREDLISRRHCKISLDRAEPPEFTVTDLGSRNGTFVNKQRIFAPFKLMAGDVVQLGPGGPEFQFDVDPRPPNLVRATRLADAAPVALVPTREGLPATVAAAGASASVGRATVERMMAETRSKTALYVALGLLGVVLAIGAAAALVLWRRQPPPPQPPPGLTTLTPTQIAQANTDSVVFFEVGWKLVDMESGRQLNQVYWPNQGKDQQGKAVPLVPGAGDFLPIFILLGENQIEPMLTTDDGKGRYKAIGHGHSGSGFVVSPDGFILTNRHVAAAWHTFYSWPFDEVGILLVPEGQNVRRIVLPAQRFPQWVPANARFIIEGALDPSSVRIVGRALRGKNIEGRNDYLDVTFAKNRIRIPSKLVRVSDRIDVAMVKIDLPRSLRKTELFDNYETVKPGDAAIVMGYPGVSPDVVAVAQSKDVFNPETAAKVIPDPTVSVGNVGRVLRGQEGLGEGVISTFGDVYQLTINSTGGGNSGGPVFDDRGRVIGIYTSGRKLDAQISFAVPIRYGMELMGTSKVMK